jgi:hypothetical protein
MEEIQRVLRKLEDIEKRLSSIEDRLPKKRVSKTDERKQKARSLHTGFGVLHQRHIGYPIVKDGMYAGVMKRLVQSEESVERLCRAYEVYLQSKGYNNYYANRGHDIITFEKDLTKIIKSFHEGVESGDVFGDLFKREGVPTDHATDDRQVRQEQLRLLQNKTDL